jgi:cytochrome c-type biogenesis protein CcmH/NrfF
VTLPLAHFEHWVWVFYVAPVMVVVLGLITMTLLERRRERDDE